MIQTIADQPLFSFTSEIIDDVKKTFNRSFLNTMEKVYDIALIIIIQGIPSLIFDILATPFILTSRAAIYLYDLATTPEPLLQNPIERTVQMTVENYLLESIQRAISFLSLDRQRFVKEALQSDGFIEENDPRLKGKNFNLFSWAIECMLINILMTCQRYEPISINLISRSLSVFWHIFELSSSSTLWVCLLPHFKNLLKKQLKSHRKSLLR